MFQVVTYNDTSVKRHYDKNTIIEQKSEASTECSSPKLPSSIKCSLSSRYGILCTLGYLCLWSLTVVSGFNPGLPYKTSRITSLPSSSPPPTPMLVMEAVPRTRKFKRLRKRLFSRTRRNYINDGPSATVDEVEAETATTTATKFTGDAIDDVERLKIGKRIQAIRKAKHIKKVRVLSVRPLKKRKKEKERLIVNTVDELRNAVLDQQLRLSDTKIMEREVNTNSLSATSKTSEEIAKSSPLMDHAVRNLIKERFLSRSTPGNRHASDNSTLAIAIEGGGMRGCVSAGMVAAITALGLSDAIDTIYGSSAGSVVGAYMVSRQVCMDVYVDILPASKELFVCKKRMMRNLASLGLGRMLSSKNGDNNNKQRSKNSSRRSMSQMRERLCVRPSLLSLSPLRDRLINTKPGMNISFVLDGILGDNEGLRPLDLEAFRENDKHQKLRVVSSCVDPHTGKLCSRCFGSDDFFHEDHTMVRADREREGLFACLQASMTVPGATGPPVNLVRKSSIRKNGNEDPPLPCFDAFCFEPIPYRSAVEEGATHVIMLASRPEDFMPITKPGIYETRIAPLYFNAHGQRKVSEFFEQGGQQYLYAEDYMLLKEAIYEKHEKGSLVPPPEILYGIERTKEVTKSIRDREQGWNRAHLFPLQVPKGYKELDPLEQNKDAVLEAVRDGFMTAFDILSDIVGLEGYDGKDVAELIFPSSEDITEAESNLSTTESSLSTKSKSMMPTDEEVLRTPLRVPGEPIPRYGVVSSIDKGESSGPWQRHRRIIRRIIRRRGRARGLFGHGSHNDQDTIPGGQREGQGEPKTCRTNNEIRLDEHEFSAATLLDCLPGFQDGRFGHLAKGLREQQMQQQH